MLVKFIDCTEKYHKQTSTIINFLSDYFNKQGIENKTLKLSELKMATCTQCRCCTQKKGENPIKCVIKDELNDSLKNIESANRYVIISDRNNLFSENKIHKKFSERLIAYYYWPYGQPQSVLRKVAKAKSSILINYNTTKYFMNHSFYTSRQYLEHTSNSIGAKVLDWQSIRPKKDLIKSYEKRLIEMADSLIHSFEEKAS